MSDYTPGHESIELNALVEVLGTYEAQVAAENVALNDLIRSVFEEN